MVITKEVLDRFFREQEAKPVDLNSFLEEVSPLVRVAVKETAYLFLEEPSFKQLETSFLTLFLLCYRQRNKSIKEWVESDFEEEELTKKEKEVIKANLPWVEEEVAEACLILTRGGSALALLAAVLYKVHTCIQMQKEIAERKGGK